MTETPDPGTDPGSNSGSGDGPGSEQPGYWEQQAAQGPVPPSAGPQFNQQSAYPAAGSDQPGSPPPAYGPPSTYGQPAYGQPAYGQPAYGQPPYGQPGFPAGVAPNHPQATTAMVTGIIALAGGFMCYLPLLAGPFAWFMGQKAKREIDAQPGRYGGRGQAQAGQILGIIATVFLALGLIAIIVLVIVAINDPNAFDS